MDVFIRTMGKDKPTDSKLNYDVMGIKITIGAQEFYVTDSGDGRMSIQAKSGRMFIEPTTSDTVRVRDYKSTV